MLHAKQGGGAGGGDSDFAVKFCDGESRRRPMSETNIQEVVKQKYGQAAKQVAAGGTACCGGDLSGCDPITKNLYDEAQTSGLPAEAVAASLGCGNPTALARENQKKVGVGNVEFLKGAIENIPLPENTVDVIISNCVINLSGDKDRVLAEAFRVLKPGGRLAVSDVVVRDEVPAEIRKSMELWVGCIAGALEEKEYQEKLARAGFESIEVEATRVYKAEEARDFLAAAGLDPDTVGPQIDGKFISAFVRAVKPASKAACCGPSCCV